MAPRRDQRDDLSDEGPVYVDDDHQRISEFAADFLDDDERESFVDHLMERRGYQRIQGWGPRADPDDGQGADAGDDGQGDDGGRGRGRSGGGGSSRRRGGYFKR